MLKCRLQIYIKNSLKDILKKIFLYPIVFLFFVGAIYFYISTANLFKLAFTASVIFTISFLPYWVSWNFNGYENKDQWTDIDFNNGTISVNKSFTDNASSEKALDPKTDSSNRTIQIDSITLNKLREHKEKFYQGICPYVFPNRSCNLPITGRNFKHRVLKPALEELEMDMDINLHTFRHTSVFLARQSGADVLSISKRLFLDYCTIYLFK